MSDPAKVLEDALDLEPNQRAQIARELIESLEDGDVDAEALWRAEISRRIDEIEAGTAELEDWDTVRKRLRSAVRR